MKYNIVYADPPWDYDDKRNHKSVGAVLSQYPTMSTEELCNLHVPSVCETQTMLFLWCTEPKQKEAIQVAEAWGFKIVTTAFVWVKLNPNGQGLYSGMGHYTNSNIERVLLGRNHKRPLQRMDTTVKQIVMAPRRAHSEKPDEVRLRIERLFGWETKRIELFGRKVVPDWTVLGNAISGQTIQEDLLKLNEE